MLDILSMRLTVDKIISNENVWSGCRWYWLTQRRWLAKVAAHKTALQKRCVSLPAARTKQS